MKKVILGIIIGALLLVGGCMAMIGGVANEASNTIKDIENEKVDKDVEYQKIADKIEWKVNNDQFLTTIEGVLENTLSEEIDYIQFDCKTLDKDGVVVEKTFTNETDIAPGEKRKVKIMITNDKFEKFKIKAASSVF